MKRGDYVLEIMPRQYPLFTEDMEIPTASATGDSVLKVIGVRTHWRDASEMVLTVQGFFCEDNEPLHAEDRINTTLLVNRYAYVPEVGQVVLRLPKGPYDIRFDLDEGRFDMSAELGTTTWSSFRHDFSSYARAHALLNLRYWEK